jgi:anti-sigma B factor antagonist
MSVRGELDLSTSPQLGDALRQELDRGRAVLLDLSEVAFIDSTGLNTLVEALRSCDTNRGTLALTPALSAQVSRVFEITGLDEVLPIESE